MPSSDSPPTKPAMKTENITLGFTVDVKANKQQNKQAVKKLYDLYTAKVSTLIRPNGENKVYVPLAPDYDAFFGCYQQNWDHLNCVQLVNAKYVYFST